MLRAWSPRRDGLLGDGFPDATGVLLVSVEACDSGLALTTGWMGVILPSLGVSMMGLPSGLLPVFRLSVRSCLGLSLPAMGAKTGDSGNSACSRTVPDDVVLALATGVGSSRRSRSRGGGVRGSGMVMVSGSDAGSDAGTERGRGGGGDMSCLVSLSASLFRAPFLLLRSTQARSNRKAIETAATTTPMATLTPVDIPLWLVVPPEVSDALATDVSEGSMTSEVVVGSDMELCELCERTDDGIAVVV